MKHAVRKEQLCSLMKAGTVRLVTSFGDMELKPSQGTALDNGEIAYENSFARAVVSVYEKGGETVYRSVRLFGKTELTLYRVDFVTEFEQEPQEFIEYKSFL